MHKAPKPVDLEVGENIKTARKARGMSQTALAERLGVTFQQVQKYEKGANRVSASTLVDIARALGMRAALLLPDEHQGRKAPTLNDLVRQKLLAAASAASGATMDLIEAARNGTLRQRDMDETFTQLVDATRLAKEALETGAAGKEVIVHDMEVGALVYRILEANHG